MVRLILAGPADAAARALARRWGRRALLAGPADLSRPGWRHSVGEAGEAAAAAGDRFVDAAELEAVVVRLGAVTAGDLDGIRGEDRAYAAQEMTAFLLAWLDDLPCPVLNRPVPGCLNGPAWRPAQWAAAAAAAGLAPAPAGAAQGVTVCVVGGRCLGPAHPAAAARVRGLAAAAGTTLLEVRLDGGGPDARFAGAHAWPDLGDPAVAGALEAHLDAIAGRVMAPC
jgi:hypothetical protein